MSTHASTGFDLAGFCGAIEQRDSEAQLTMYAPDANVTITDRMTPPGSPRVLKGRDEIRGWIEDVCGREMSHAVQHSVQDERGAAFTEKCRYPDGTNVICATVLELSGGQIVDQAVVQAWDEA